MESGRIEWGRTVEAKVGVDTEMGVDGARRRHTRTMKREAVSAVPAHP
jgi:hypothetical protein